MANTLSWGVTQISTDRKTALFVDGSTYDTVNRGDFTSIDVTGNKLNADRTSGFALTFVQDPYADTDYTVTLAGKPNNEDGYYRFTVNYTPVTDIYGEHDFDVILTPTTEYTYSNMISELSEECCSVDFRMDRIMNLLILGCFVDSIFVIKDRVAANEIGYSGYQAERLIRRAESIYE